MLVSRDDLEKILPFPIKIVICADDIFVYKNFNIRNKLQELLDIHNEKYETKIEEKIRSFIVEDDEELSNNEYAIYVGSEKVSNGKSPDCSTEKLLEKFYKSIISSTKEVLDIWHDKIIEIQEDNKLTLQLLEEKEEYEILFEHYWIIRDKKAFALLKKLNNIYPGNRHYRRLLRRIYNTGYEGWHERSPKLVKKMDEKGRKKNYSCF